MDKVFIYFLLETVNYKMNRENNRAIHDIT